MPRRGRRRDLDDLDRALVAALARDGRAPHVELAARLGVSEKTVRSRIARLVAEHGLTVTAALADPGPHSRMLYLVHTTPGRRVEVARSLAEHPEVEHVHLATGAADLVVTAGFADDAAALQFQVGTVEGHPQVRAADSCHLISEVDARTAGGPRAPRVDHAALAAQMLATARHSGFDDLAEAMCDAATAGLGADRVLIVTNRPGTHRPAPAKRRGISDRYLSALVERIADGRTDGVIRRVWDTRLHVFVADARTDPLLAAAHDLVRAEGYVGLLTLPILHGDSLLATISLYFDRPTEPDDEYMATAQGVADHFAVALARALGRAPAPLTGSAPSR